MIPTPEQAYELVCEYNEGEFHRKHARIVGDVMRSSIREIWNSEKAKSLYFIKQTDIPDDSLCHSCTRFDECRALRQVCYREIMRKYGSDKWYYPDINCPFSAR